MYYNTTAESGKALQKAVRKVLSQDERIETLMIINGEMSASQLLRHFAGTPITSIRRSLNTLTKAGKLEKTDKKRQGIYGRSEYIWKKV